MRAYFVLRWGDEHGIQRGTKVNILRSWVDEPVHGPKYLAFGFQGARSALDHLFWFLPLIWSLVSLYERLQQLGPRTPYNKCSDASVQSLPLCWQAVCHMRAQPRGALQCRRCSVCDVLEVMPPGPAPQHFRRRWIRPCTCSHLYAHRSCLEEQLLADSAVVGLAATPKSPDSSESSPRSTMEFTCSECGVEFRVSTRFPETITELVVATLQEWRWVMRRVFMTLFFFLWMYTVASHYVARSGNRISNELGLLLVLTATMMSISMSKRFHCGVQKIWHTPNRFRYFKLFALFVTQNLLVPLRAVGPSLWTALDVDAEDQASWLGMAKRLHHSFAGTALLSCISVLHFATTSGVIFCFWKTSLRVPTVADADGVAEPVGDLAKNVIDAEGGNRHECGLCQLGLCLDNTFM